MNKYSPLPMKPVFVKTLFCDICMTETTQIILLVNYEFKTHIIEYRIKCTKCRNKSKPKADASFWLEKMAECHSFKKN